jgi:hypothetical protein
MAQTDWATDWAGVDHLEWAKAYRNRAANCAAASKTTSSKDFADCYRQLSRLYENFAKLEEDYVDRERERARAEFEFAIAAE